MDEVTVPAEMMKAAEDAVCLGYSQPLTLEVNKALARVAVEAAMQWLSVPENAASFERSKG